MSSPVLDDETLRFGRLLHYAGLAIVLVAGAAAYHWFYEPVERNMLDAAMKIDELVVSRQNAGVIRHEHERLSSHLQDIEARYSALEAARAAQRRSRQLPQAHQRDRPRRAAGDQQLSAGRKSTQAMVTPRWKSCSTAKAASKAFARSSIGSRRSSGSPR